MALTPFEQAAAEAATGLIITGGQKGNATAIVKRAQTALAVGTALQGLAAGNSAPAISALQAVLQSASFDPGVALAVQGLVTLGQQQLALVNQLGSLIPLAGLTAEAVATNIAAGVIAAANAELKRYETTSSTSSSSPAPTPPA